MLAPRRVGKTWIMHRLEEDVRSDQWATVFCDVEGMSDETEFLKQLCEQIQTQESLTSRTTGHLAQRLKQLLSEGGWSTIQEALGKVNWKTFSEALIKSLNTSPNPTVILIDEISVFVMARLRRDPATAVDFLYHLRSLRQRYTNVRWLFAGSVGLDTIARRATLSGSLLGMTPFSVEPFSHSAARAFLDDFCKDGKAFRPFSLTEESFSHFARELGWLAPYYLEQLAHVIRPSGPMGPASYPIATINDIEKAFAALLTPQQRVHFAAWEEHLTKNFERQDEDRLRSILAICARRPTGEQFSTLQSAMSSVHASITTRELRDLLSALVNDGFLLTKGTRYQFHSGLVRKYWLKYHAD